MTQHTVFRVHFRTEFGDSISIRGSSHDLSWEYGHEATWGLTESGEDIWELVIVHHHDEDMSTNEFIHFKPLLNDEVWSKGADYIVHPGHVIDIYPFFFATRGTVSRTLFESIILDNSRKIAIYLPPSYHENEFKRYPVIYFNDGHNLFDTKDSFCSDTWQVGETMDELCCNGAIEEAIVVGIYPVQREFEYLPIKGNGHELERRGGGADRYLDALTHELRPRIEESLRTTHKSAIMGSSYGGVISLYAWISRPGAFDICGAFSPSLRYADGMLVNLIKNKLGARPDYHKLYMDCGSVRDGGVPVIEMADYLMKDDRLQQDQFLFVLGEGHQHTERHWALRFPRAMVYMFADPQRDQHSPQFTMESSGSDTESV